VKSSIWCKMKVKENHFHNNLRLYVAAEQNSVGTAINTEYDPSVRGNTTSCQFLVPYFILILEPRKEWSLRIFLAANIVQFNVESLFKGNTDRRWPLDVVRQRDPGLSSTRPKLTVKWSYTDTQKVWNQNFSFHFSINGQTSSPQPDCRALKLRARGARRGGCP
jgi:hypothetical protein